MFKTKSSKFIGLLAIAGLAVGSGAAFTASNDFTAQPAIVAGYGSVSVSGATVLDTSITQDTNPARHSSSRTRAPPTGTVPTRARLEARRPKGRPPTT